MLGKTTRVCDLGALQGEVLLFGGPYSNLQASRALLERADSMAIAAPNRICTGDMIAYCANPAETLAALLGQVQTVAGNCEQQIAAGASDCGCGFEPGSACDVLSGGWYPFAAEKIGARQRQILAGLPDVLAFAAFGRRYAVIHGGVSDISRFLWPCSDDAEFVREIAAVGQLVGPVDGIIAGHCGLAFQRTIGGVHWINPGAIGLPPNDGCCDTRYAILRPSGVTFERLVYDAGAARAAMEAEGLVQGYERALTDGWWPSEDILPASLRRQPSRASG